MRLRSYPGRLRVACLSGATKEAAKPCASRAAGFRGPSDEMGALVTTQEKGASATVAALFVDPRGVYANLPGVELWDEARDARLYAGPFPVVAHPPCARWSRLAGFTEARFGYKQGEDGGCFEAALDAVQRFGGVLEHPAYSAAFRAFELPHPVTRTGWTSDLWDRGASCYIEQGRYGAPVKKATWLYVVGIEPLPQLRWGYTADCDVRDGSGGGTNHGAWREYRSNSATSLTPPEFRDVLLGMARTADVRAAA